jgi:transketolase
VTPTHASKNVDPALMANAIRALTIDAVERANSGHPGMPMGMAEIAVALWGRHLKHNPANPAWSNRDRFVLSNGHGSMLLYGLLHLTGYDLSIDDLKGFRQLHSRTPGHPEYGYAPGVETTTGPLGQGLANAVGMALAESLLAAEFNRESHLVVDHRTYAFIGDGCLMEGISHEAASLAGTLGLGKLIVIYDDNGISIDGHVEHWFADDTPKRFEAYGWRVIRAVDGHDVAAVEKAIELAKNSAAQPTLICCKTSIGKGAPSKAGSHDSHGSPLGAAEAAGARTAIGWAHPQFEIPKNVYDVWSARDVGAEAELQWDRRFAKYSAAYPELAAEFDRRMRGDLPADFGLRVSESLKRVLVKAATIATRKASQYAIEEIAAILPELVGGSADLASSNLTLWPEAKGVSRGSGGNYIYYGVREFGMTAIMNGLAIHGGLRPFGGTFLMFSEYARNALRMAALMKLNTIYVFTHDSIALGQDGPTHQPIEQIATLRLMPNMDVWRPCDAFETMIAWQVAIEHRKTPTSLILSRQNLTFQPRDDKQQAAVRRGGYVLAMEEGALEAVIIATGSEVDLAMQARGALAQKGVHCRVVSLPSTYQFDRQDAAYRQATLPDDAPRLAIEAGVGDYWRKYVGLSGAVIGIDTFGESAPANVLLDHFGFTVANVVKTVENLLKRQSRSL